MTKAYLALQDFNGVPTLVKGHQYIMSEQSAKELGMDSLSRKKVVKELTEDEALALYKGQ